MASAATDLRVAFRTLGCKVNRVESEDIAADLLSRGVTLVDENVADVVVINTCTVTGEADAKARKAVRAALRSTSSAVVVTGCLAALDADALRSLGDRVIVEADKRLVADRVASALGISERGSKGAAPRAGDGFRTRALIKIEDGCDAFCSYCIVPYARGLPRSETLASVVSAAEDLVRAGASEIVLTGINLGRYEDGARDLADLLHAVADTGAQRIRLSSIEPLDLTDRLLDVLAEIPEVCPHLHVPLQSGCDAVLKAMRRNYTIKEYERCIDRARAAISGLAVTTDVIAGFPGETARQASETVEACDRIGFAKLHVFRYSERAGTAAASMPQVSPELRAERAATLRECGDRLRHRFMDSRRDTLADVLIERVVESGLAEGTTSDYLRVRLPAPSGADVGSIVRVRLGERVGELVSGVPVEHAS